MPERPDYRLTFRVLPGETPPEIRLRALLKFALRSLRLRCVKAEEVHPDEEPARDERT